MVNPVNFLKETKVELSKVIWPSRETLMGHSLVVIASIVIAVAVIGLMDYGLFYLAQKLIFWGMG